MNLTTIFVNYIGRFCLFVLMTPIYWISRLVPKNKNIWIFGAWFGEQYNDNSKYLFEYVNQYQPQIKAIWLSKNKEVINRIRAKGYIAYHSYSITGFAYSSLAKICIVNHGIVDVNKFVPPSFIINLWHGIPLKKIMYDDLINRSNSNVYIKNLKKIIFPFTRYPENSKMMIACAQEDQKNISTAFKIPIQNVKITGYPRNDALFIKKMTKSSEKFNVLYAPTHRRGGKINIANLLLNDIFEINKKLNSINGYLNIKLHFCHQNESRYLENIIQNNHLENVKVLNDNNTNGDIYSYLNNFDVLITDYSSIYFDYLLTDKPIIFAPFDYDDYISNDREHYYDYNAVTPGPKCINWEEVCEWIKSFKENPFLYQKEREIIKNKFHMYKDGNSAKRVSNEILKIISQESRKKK